MNVSRKPIACITIVLMSVCTLHSGEVALTVTSGEKTLTQALSGKAKTLGGDDDLVKMGSGTLKILAASDVANGALPSSYSGNILVREGVLYVDSLACVGNSNRYTKVYAGAQLQTYSAAANSLSFGDEHFVIAGNGPDNNGAIYCVSTVTQYGNARPFGGLLELTADARIRTAYLHGFCGVVDMNGHALSLSGDFTHKAGSDFRDGKVAGVGVRELSPTEPATKADFGAVITVTDGTWRSEP